MENKVKTYCHFDQCPCKHRALPSIGANRKNGAGHHTDWVGRKYHKRCFKKMIQYKEIQRYMRAMDERFAVLL